MDNYSVIITKKAYLDLDNIYSYIAHCLLNKESALKIIEDIEETILNLSTYPERGSERKNGKYADGKHRQLFVDNYIVIYRVNKEEKNVIILTVQYNMRNE